MYLVYKCSLIFTYLRKWESGRHVQIKSSDNSQNPVDEWFKFYPHHLSRSYKQKSKLIFPLTLSFQGKKKTSKRGSTREKSNRNKHFTK